MNKGQLIGHLRECIKIEEAAIPMCARHVTNTLFLSGFTPQEQKIISDILNQLRLDAKRHKLIFEALVRSVEGSQQNDY